MNMFEDSVQIERAAAWTVLAFARHIEGLAMRPSTMTMPLICCACGCILELSLEVHKRTWNKSGWRWAQCHGGQSPRVKGGICDALPCACLAPKLSGMKQTDRPSAQHVK